VSIDIDHPVFLDCEASSLSADSYPIEIAWWDAQVGEIESHLINPYKYPESFTDWSKDAEMVHGLSRMHLSYHGQPPISVAERMNAVLEGATVYTDAPDFDGFWVRRLMEACKLEMTFYFADINTLLKEILPIEYWSVPTGWEALLQLKIDARKATKLPRHRAGNDVAYLVELYKSARKLAGYYV